MMKQRLIGCVLVGTIASHAGAQSLYQRQTEVPLSTTGEPDPQADLREKSMLFFEPPPPRTFAKHDIITIIVDESSRQESSQSLDTKKEYDTQATLRGMLDPLELLELRLAAGNISNLDLIDYQADREFKGEGDYERTDRFSARISARVLEVKPNGTLVLEARTYIKTDDEEATLVLAGVARPEDVTTQNTVRSSQMANLTVIRENSGEVANAAEKGLITRVLDTLFAF
ncbi:MAG: flagellar basal body L-ring protein FlgH [Phycisphaerales bacterium JB059]